MVVDVLAAVAAVGAVAGFVTGSAAAWWLLASTALGLLAVWSSPVHAACR